jgi:hypothetical protein
MTEAFETDLQQRGIMEFSGSFAPKRNQAHEDSRVIGWENPSVISR